MRIMRTGAVALAVVAVAVGTAGVATARPAGPGDGWSGGPNRSGDPVAAVTVDLTDEEVAGLVFTREEEAMARDLYQVFAELYPETEVFTRIATSEQRHFDAIGNVLERYGIDDPSTGEPGVYVDDAVQDLYDGWLADGSESVQAAYEVGVELERVDVEDLQGLIDATDNAMLDRVYSNLLAGSENHLAAFEAAAAGETPALCTQDGTGMQDRQMMGRGGRGPGHRS